ncbi:MAG: aminotransferase class III-fold pyridoxal phosphate-dependent enzyme [Alphaproteobacteria bacterium]|nr:aminotransferase class III-fold pyridoxal phosphate-dependent enzyme [Alphaproteobacteria bacterium]
MTDFKHLEQADKDHVLHPFTVLKDFSEGKTGDPRIVTGGKGIHIQDQNGNDLIDAFAGLYCMNIGYGREGVAEAMYEQAKKLAYCHTYAQQSNEPVIRLSERLCKMAPGNMERVFYGMSGSDANETQIKLVWYYHNVLGKPEKKKIIARERGYHGSSIMSGSLTGLPVYHTLFDQPLKPMMHTGSPHYYWNAEDGESELEFSKRRAKELEDLILAQGPDTIGGFIAEPVLGTGGITPPPEGYWKEIQAVLKKYDILLIADEVVTGFGRTGEMFGCFKYDIEPDLITAAKGLTSAYVPLSAAIVSKKVSDVLKQGSDMAGMFSHGYTYSGHPVGAACANAVLDIVENEDLPGNARDTGAYFQKRLQETFADKPLVGEVRGVGLMGAIEFVADKDKKVAFEPSMKVGARISKAALDEGIIARGMPHGDILGFSPPLCVTKEEVDVIIERAEKAIDTVADELSREGLLAA